MADRSVKVVVSADVSAYKSAMQQAQQSTDGLAEKGSSLGDTLKKGLALAGVGGGVVALGAAIKGTIGLGVDLQTNLNTLGAVTGATGTQMAAVSKLAQQLGNDMTLPATSASDAAQAMVELAKGGLSVDDAMKAAHGTLELAAAAQVDGATAATIQANALNTFSLSADQADHVADVLANTANAASGGITDFAQGMQQAGSVAKLFGISLDDTSTVLGLFANNGIKGSDAGTSLKTMLTQLATPSKNAQAAMQDLGLKVYDASGQFVGMRSLTEQLATAQKNMSQAAFQSAAGIVFGSDAIRGASILASEGTDQYDKMRGAIEKSGGAADLANAQMKGLGGAFQNAMNAAQNAALDGFNAVAPALETIVNAGAHVIDFLDGLPGPVKLGIAAFAGFKLIEATGVFQKIGGGLSGLVRQIAILSAAQDANGVSLGKWGAIASVTGSKLSGVAKAIGPGLALAAGVATISAIIDGFTHVNESIQAVTQSSQDLGKQLSENNGKWDDTIQKSYEAAITGSDVFQALVADGADYGKTLAVLTGHANLYSDAAQEVSKHLGALSIDQTLAMGSLLHLKDATEANSASLQDYNTRLASAGQAVALSAGDFRKAEEASEGAYQAYQTYYKMVMQWSPQMRGAIQDSTGAWKTFGQSLPVSTLAALHEPITGIDTALGNAALAAYNNARGTEASNKAMDNAAKAFYGTDKAASGATTSVDLFAAAMDRLAGRNGDAAAAQRANQAAIRAVGSAYRDQQAAADAVTQAQIDLKAAQDKKITSDYTAAQKALDVAQAQRGLKAAVDGVADANDKAADAQDAAVQSADSMVLAVYNGQVKTKGYTAAVAAASAEMGRQRAAFIDSEVAAGKTRDAAEKLADQLGLIPKNVTTVIEASTTKAQQDIDAVRVSLTKLNGLTVTTYVNTVTGETHFRTGSGAIGQATGGWVTGVGGPTEDNQLRRLSVGEFVMNAAAAKKYGPMLESMNGGLGTGGAGMAAGGYVAPSAASLAGVQTPSLGPVGSTVQQAIAAFRDSVVQTGQAANDAADKANTLRDAWSRARNEQIEMTKSQADNVAQVRKDQAAKVADAQRDAAERVSDAKAKISAAKTTAAHAAAEKAYAVAQRESAESVKKAQDTQTAAVNKAVAAQKNANAAEQAKVDAAKKQWDAAKADALTAKERAVATADMVGKTKAFQAAQGQLANALDATNNRLADARSHLSDLQQQRSQLAGSVAGGLTGSGLAQYTAAGNAGDVVQAAKKHLQDVSAFGSNLKKLSALGLNSTDLQNLASAGVDQAGSEVASLAGAGAATIKSLNGIEAQTRASANSTGAFVGQAVYGSQINSAQASVNSLAAQSSQIQKLLQANANVLTKVMADGLHGVSFNLNINGQQVEAVVAKVISKQATTAARG